MNRDIWKIYEPFLEQMLSSSTEMIQIIFHFMQNLYCNALYREEEEIAKNLDLPVEEVSQAMDAVCAPVSLYDPVYSDGGDPLTVMDQVRDTRNTDEHWMEHIALQSAFTRLNPREKQILSLRFYDGKTQMEVAGALGISQAQVSRLEKSAISDLRKGVSVS